MLLAWESNDEFGFGIYSAGKSIRSTNADAIKRAISAKINSATHFLCIVGPKTCNSGWVAWKID
ncbi:MAG: hypothetical protein DWQ47_04615 [Acidobacteria bacterium]|nr:MAG: hypothetical protein DWQ32_08165 [Acidobacteriota bacterium]REK01671.1 MAG: hypothetical protein DWQ38_04600 [Acidobacteriota bacterium]REK14627.1 MAG: hypothetical protein DWQ43_13855 [Acidobacteriota bacterium]REK45342.1 MAG: hypothetical protein DWQ47_04615 [Acidobacteriota bacterium]